MSKKRSAVDITTAPNYDKGCVWVKIGDMKRTCISPDTARQMADEMESEANQMKADSTGFEHEEVVTDLRRFADEVESGAMGRGGGDE